MNIVKKNKGVDTFGNGLILREGLNENVDRRLWDGVRYFLSVRQKLHDGIYIVEEPIEVESEPMPPTSDNEIDEQEDEQPKRRRGRRGKQSDEDNVQDDE